MKITFKQYIHERKADRDTEKFRAWFGRSKIVVDSEPQVCYHATPNDFEAFKVGGVDPKISGHAIWLSTNPKELPASHNIGSPKRGYKQGTRVLAVYVKMERPLVIDDKEMLKWAQDVFAQGSENFPQVMPKDWVDEITKDGEYDGIIFDGKKLYGHDYNEIIVFKPNQIKSAIGNNGEYSLDDDHIGK